MCTGAVAFARARGGWTHALGLVVRTGTALALAGTLALLWTCALAGSGGAAAGGLLAVRARAVALAVAHCRGADTLGLVVGTLAALACAGTLALLWTRAECSLLAVLARAPALARTLCRGTHALALVFSTLAAVASASTLALLWARTFDAAVAARVFGFRIAARHSWLV